MSDTILVSKLEYDKTNTRIVSSLESSSVMKRILQYVKVLVTATNLNISYKISFKVNFYFKLLQKINNKIMCMEYFL